MLFKDCKVIECDEAYTSKTCGYCGTINYKLCSSKVFRCKHEDCTKKLVKSDRDVIFMQLEIYYCAIYLVIRLCVRQTT